jgi:hypothetical protein
METFRTFEYNGKVLQIAQHDDTTLKKTTPLADAPGAGKFEIGAIDLSASTVAEGETFTLTTRIIGKHIAFLYTEILLRDKDLNQFYGPVAREYIRAEKEKTTGGVNRPAWGHEINLALDLTPHMRLLTDGVDSAFGFLIPGGYGASNYRLDGLYTSADGATSRRAQITFNNAGKTTDVIAYAEQGFASTPHALTLKQDDRFAPFVQILTAPADENSAWQVTRGLSTALTYRGQPLSWTTEALMPGEYLVGALVQDLDGNLTRKYAPLTVSK